MTTSLATLFVPKQVHEEIRKRLVAANADVYRYLAPAPGILIDMQGIGLLPDVEPKPGEEKGKKKSKRKLLQSELWMQEVAKGKDTIAAIKAKMDEMDTLFADLHDTFTQLEGWKDGYSERLGNIPENLSNGEHAEKLKAIDEISLDASDAEDLNSELVEKLDSLEEVLDECENADLPKN